MTGLLRLTSRVGRSRRMRVYREIKAELEALSPAVLADMGMKRAQAATVARKLALR